MRWVTPTEKDVANHLLEKRLRDAVDQFRANSGLKAGQYSTPVLGLIFLRFAESRFVAKTKKNPLSELSMFGVERIDETRRLCRMNLAVHGLEAVGGS